RGEDRRLSRRGRSSGHGDVARDGGGEAVRRVFAPGVRGHEDPAPRTHHRSRPRDTRRRHGRVDDADGVTSVLPPLSIRLVTERLVLRPPRTADVAEIRRLLRRNHEHLKPWNPAPPPGEDPSSITEVSKTVLRQRREWKRGTGFVFMVAPRDSPGSL